MAKAAESGDRVPGDGGDAVGAQSWAAKKELDMSDKHNDDNHANQLNPNHEAYWQSRGYDERPDDWEDRAG